MSAPHVSVRSDILRVPSAEVNAQPRGTDRARAVAAVALAPALRVPAGEHDMCIRAAPRRATTGLYSMQLVQQNELYMYSALISPEPAA